MMAALSFENMLHLYTSDNASCYKTLPQLFRLQGVYCEMG